MAFHGFMSCIGCGRLFKDDGSEDDLYDNHDCTIRKMDLQPLRERESNFVRMLRQKPAMYRSRDIGSGVEFGEYFPIPLGPPDTWGKRPYATPNGGTVYLFDDELQDPPRRTELLMLFQRLAPHETNESWRLNN